MSNVKTLINDLVIANRILANEDVVDAYGHVSVRHPDDPSRFFLARSLAPEFITPKDIMEFTLDGEPVKKGGPAPYLERFHSWRHLRSTSRCDRSRARACGGHSPFGLTMARR
jgi:HCOMODA/2-hydroxy-3-carboxy-muconic semialdehyde decarboxylase